MDDRRIYLSLIVIRDKEILLEHNSKLFDRPLSSLWLFPTTIFFNLPNGGLWNLAQSALSEELGCPVDFLSIPFYYREESGGREFFIFSGELSGPPGESAPRVSDGIWIHPLKIKAETVNEWVLPALNYFRIS